MKQENAHEAWRRKHGPKGMMLITSEDIREWLKPGVDVRAKLEEKIREVEELEVLLPPDDPEPKRPAKKTRARKKGGI